MPSIENMCKKLRVEEVQGTLLGEKRKIFRGIPSTKTVVLNEEGVEALISRGYRPLTYGDELQRGWLARYDDPRNKLIALGLMTKLHQPIEDSESVENIVLINVGVNWFQDEA